MVSTHLPDALYLAEQVADAERKLVEHQQVSLYDLVERAGLAAFNEFTHQQANAETVLVLLGSGNNAADGLVVARLLLASGRHVTAMSCVKARHSVEYQLALRAFTDIGGQVGPFDLPQLMQAPVIIDALLGTGFCGELKPPFEEVIDSVNASDAWVLSLDLPSGLNADTGSCSPHAVKASVTVVFGALKQGLFTGRARQFTGEITFADIGLTPYLTKPSAMRVDQDYLLSVFKPRARDSHKGTSGKVVVVGGDYGMPGAVRLAAEACLRAGAGLVAVVSRPEHQLIVVGSRPELMFLGCELVDMEVYHRLGWASALVIGPGLGKHDWGYNLLKAVSLSDKPCVVDADALNLLGKEPHRQLNWVLTPHSGEAARLLGISVAEVEEDRYRAVKALQAKYGGVVLLKGAGTLIYDGTNCVVAPVGNPGLASGGCGDVLSGIIGALMAQGIDSMKATIAAVVVHGVAAELAAPAGERGMLASDLMPYIRELVNYHC